MNSLTLIFYFKQLIDQKNFIEHIIDEDLKNGFLQSKLKFRFPPEPNGYLHIGHVKAICVNFNLNHLFLYFLFFQVSFLLSINLKKLLNNIY